MWRDWFTFSRQDRRAILLLSALIILAFGLLFTRPIWKKSAFIATRPDSIASLLQPSAPIVTITPHQFDPNNADSLELLSVGLPPHAVGNILRYRTAGGHFRRPEDLKRIYGLHDSVFMQIKPYIAISVKEQHKNATSKGNTLHYMTVDENTRPIQPETPSKHKHPYAEYMQSKHKPGQTVDLNLADTTEFMRIPGIGPVYAKMIVDYRRQLGGYHHVSQLKELDMLPEDIGDWVHVSTAPKEKIHINKLSVTQLRSHPYISFYQAKAIVELRKREGNIKSVRQLLFLSEFTENDILRLTPYLSFE